MAGQRHQDGSCLRKGANIITLAASFALGVALTLALTGGSTSPQAVERTQGTAASATERSGAGASGSQALRHPSLIDAAPVAPSPVVIVPSPSAAPSPCPKVAEVAPAPPAKPAGHRRIIDAKQLPPPKPYACMGGDSPCVRETQLRLQDGTAVPCTLQWVGSGASADPEYGKWPVCMHDMQGKAALSFGVGRDASFDMSLLVHAKLATVHAFDPTLDDLALIEVEPHPEPGFHIHRVGLGVEKGTSTFMKPIKGYASFANNKGMAGQNYIRKDAQGKPISVELPVDTVHGLAKEYGFDWVALVKADVEGAEFDYFARPDLVEALPTSQVLMEFHDRLVPQGSEKRAKVIKVFEDAGWQTILNGPEHVNFVRKP